MATRRTHITRRAHESEFSGETRDNGVLAKDRGMPLKAWERMRLIYRTGTEDVEAPYDRRAFIGWEKYPNSEIDFED